MLHTQSIKLFEIFHRSHRDRSWREKKRINNYFTMKVIIFLFLLSASLSECQESGSFWWKNKQVVDKASQSRSLREQTAKVRTLPPRYKHESDEDNITTQKSISIFDSDEEDHANYKYDNSPDCVCVPKYLCNANNTLITDGSGLIDER
jgi:hypothetical protein